MNKDRSRLYEIWATIKKRTLDRSNKDYPKYGARGITLCEEWMDFETFYQWAITHGYRDGLTLDRVNNCNGYNPYNCRWKSRRGQALNRRTNTIYTIDGHTKTLKEWSEQYGVPDHVICHRIERGWKVEDAIKTPRRGYKRN